MKPGLIIASLLAALVAKGLGSDDFMDHVDEALAFSADDGLVRARLSGTFDAEGYLFQQPPPGLIDSSGNSLVNPRLSLFLDGQIGGQFYVFAQLRVDRGFDPANEGAGVRLDEYALRYTPWDDGRFSFQIGKFANIIGNWAERHQSWDNPFITAPLPYENITAVEDKSAPSSAGDFALGIVDAKYEYNPVIWGPGYSSGISAGGQLGMVDYAVALLNSAPASRPETWDLTQTGFAHPSVQARLGLRPDVMWRLGLSAARGPYYQDQAAATLPAHRGIGDYDETVIGQDISFAWHHWQLWAEIYEARFDVPRVGAAYTFAYYLEAKYKFTPQLFGALRWNQQLFGDVPDGTDGSSHWGNNIWRIDTSMGYRFTPHTQLKLQYSLQHEDSVSGNFSNLLAAQFTLRF
jgi:hypothetical protein